MLAIFFTNWFHYFYVPAHGAWYSGQVWGNLFVVPILFVLGYIWSKTSIWPMNLIHKKLDKTIAHNEHQTMIVEEIHHKLHTGKDHPRVQERRNNDLHPTPTKPDTI